MPVTSRATMTSSAKTAQVGLRAVAAAHAPQFCRTGLNIVAKKGIAPGRATVHSLVPSRSGRFARVDLITCSLPSRNAKRSESAIEGEMFNASADPGKLRLRARLILITLKGVHLS